MLRNGPDPVKRTQRWVDAPGSRRGIWVGAGQEETRYGRFAGHRPGRRGAAAVIGRRAGDRHAVRTLRAHGLADLREAGYIQAAVIGEVNAEKSAGPLVVAA